MLVHIWEKKRTPKLNYSKRLVNWENRTQWKRKEKGKPLSIKHPSKLVSELVGASSLWPRKLTKNPLKTKKMCDIILVMKFSPNNKKIPWKFGKSFFLDELEFCNRNGYLSFKFSRLKLCKNSPNATPNN
jgi:hypothetical protein